MYRDIKLLWMGRGCGYSRAYPDAPSRVGGSGRFAKAHNDVVAFGPAGHVAVTMGGGVTRGRLLIRGGLLRDVYPASLSPFLIARRRLVVITSHFSSSLSNPDRPGPGPAPTPATPTAEANGSVERGGHGRGCRFCGGAA